MAKNRLQLSFPDDYRDDLEQLVKALGFVRNTQPNISAFLEAIARREIHLFPNFKDSALQQEAIFKAILALCDRAEIAAVKQLVDLLEQYPEVEASYLARIKDKCRLLLSPSVGKIEQLITTRQPFQLSYQDAAGRLWIYTIRTAEITFREKRNYLECWCEETAGNQDLPELEHNWSLRLDRIIDAAIVPIEGEWRSCLDSILVEFELMGGLAHAYQQRDSDISVEWISVDPQRKRVQRHINNTFWFVREILPYGKDCVVVSPSDVRSLVVKELKGALSNYSEKEL